MIVVQASNIFLLNFTKSSVIFLQIFKVDRIKLYLRIITQRLGFYYLSALPPNPLMITGGIYIEFTVKPTVYYYYYLFDRGLFCFIAMFETNFSHPFYKNTKLYRKLSGDPDISSLLHGPIKKLFASSQNLSDQIQIKLQIYSKVEVDLNVMERSTIRLSYSGNMISGSMSACLSADYYQKTSQVSSSFNFDLARPTNFNVFG